MEILPQLLVNSLISGSIYALASSGLSLTYGLLRVLNFAHGHLMMLGAYIYFFFCVQLNYSIHSSGLLSLLGILFISYLCMRFFVWPFVRFSLMLTLVTTLALSIILESLVSIQFGVNVKSLSTGLSIQSWEMWGVYITPVQVVIVLSTLMLMLCVGFVIHNTSLGRRVRALSFHPFGAQTLGISRRKMSFGVFLAGAVLAAFAGVMVGYETNLQPTMGNAYTIKAFAAMILGGLGNLWGTVAGSFLLGLIENLSIGLEFGGYSLPAGYKDAFAFVIILLVLLFRPAGLFSSAGRAS